RHMPRAAGPLVTHEVETITDARDAEVVLTAGLKISTKLPVLNMALNGGYLKKLPIGGAMATVFLLAMYPELKGQLGESYVGTETEFQLAKSIIEEAKRKGIELVLPEDFVITKGNVKDLMEQSAELTRALINEDNELIGTVPEGWMVVEKKDGTKEIQPSLSDTVTLIENGKVVGHVPDGWSIIDIGEKSSEKFDKIVKEAKKVFWNGPLGVFEWEIGKKATRSASRTAAKAKNTVVGGGDTIAAVDEEGLTEEMLHSSTGGGASITIYSGQEPKALPYVRATLENTEIWVPKHRLRQADFGFFSFLKKLFPAIKAFLRELNSKPDKVIIYGNSARARSYLWHNAVRNSQKPWYLRILRKNDFEITAVIGAKQDETFLKVLGHDSPHTQDFFEDRLNPKIKRNHEINFSLGQRWIKFYGNRKTRVLENVPSGKELAEIVDEADRIIIADELEDNLKLAGTFAQASKKKVKIEIATDRYVEGADAYAVPGDPNGPSGQITALTPAFMTSALTVIDALGEYLPIDGGHITGLERFTLSQAVTTGASVPKRIDTNFSASAMTNIVPASNLARQMQKTLNKVRPDIGKSFTVSYYRVPHSQGGAVALSLNLTQATSAKKVTKILKQITADPRYQGRIAVSTRTLASNMVAGRPEIAIIDPSQIVLTGDNQMIEIVIWQDPDWGQANQVAQRNRSVHRRSKKIKRWAPPAPAKTEAKPIRRPEDLTKYLEPTPDYLVDPYRPRLTDPVTGKPRKRVVGLNGPGRTGKTLFWYWFGASQKYKDEALKHSILPEEIGIFGDPEKDDLEVGAINGISGLEKIFDTYQHLPEPEALIQTWLQFLTKDDVQGKFFPHLSQEDAPGKYYGIDEETQTAWIKLHPEGNRIPLLNIRGSKAIPWKKYGVEIVIEATGGATEKKKAKALHMKGGAKKVIVSAPGKEMDASITIGVNEYDLKPGIDIISATSCTTTCIGGATKIVDTIFGIRRGLMGTWHAFTDENAAEDESKKNKDRHPSVKTNMVFTSTGAAVAIGESVPSVRGKLNGLAVRFGNPSASFGELTFEVERTTTVEEVNKAFEIAAKDGRFFIEYYKEGVPFSGTLVGNPHTGIFVSDLTRVSEDGRIVTIVLGYDNEWGFSGGLRRLASREARVIDEEEKDLPPPPGESKRPQYQPVFVEKPSEGDKSLHKTTSLPIWLTKTHELHFGKGMIVGDVSPVYFDQLGNFIMDKTAVQNHPDQIAYMVYHGVYASEEEKNFFESRGMRRDLTVIVSGVLIGKVADKEFSRVRGHIHPTPAGWKRTPQSEIYRVVSGNQVTITVEKPGTEDGQAERIVPMVRREGQNAPIPSNWKHMFSNTGTETAVTENIVAIEVTPDYSPVAQSHGLGVYYVQDKTKLARFLNRFYSFLETPFEKTGDFLKDHERTVRSVRSAVEVLNYWSGTQTAQDWFGRDAMEWAAGQLTTRLNAFMAAVPEKAEGREGLTDYFKNRTRDALNNLRPLAWKPEGKNDLALVSAKLETELGRIRGQLLSMQGGMRLIGKVFPQATQVTEGEDGLANILRAAYRQLDEVLMSPKPQETGAGAVDRIIKIYDGAVNTLLNRVDFSGDSHAGSRSRIEQLLALVESLQNILELARATDWTLQKILRETPGKSLSTQTFEISRNTVIDVLFAVTGRLHNLIVPILGQLEEGSVTDQDEKKKLERQKTFLVGIHQRLTTLTGVVSGSMTPADFSEADKLYLTIREVESAQRGLIRLIPPAEWVLKKGLQVSGAAMDTVTGAHQVDTALPPVVQEAAAESAAAKVTAPPLPVTGRIRVLKNPNYEDVPPVEWSYSPNDLPAPSDTLFPPDVPLGEAFRRNPDEIAYALSHDEAFEREVPWAYDVMPDRFAKWINRMKAVNRLIFWARTTSGWLESFAARMESTPSVADATPPASKPETAAPVSDVKPEISQSTLARGLRVPPSILNWLVKEIGRIIKVLQNLMRRVYVKLRKVRNRSIDKSTAHRFAGAAQEVIDILREKMWRHKPSTEIERKLDALELFFDDLNFQIEKARVGIGGGRNITPHAKGIIRRGKQWLGLTDVSVSAGRMMTEAMKGQSSWLHQLTHFALVVRTSELDDTLIHLLTSFVGKKMDQVWAYVIADPTLGGLDDWLARRQQNIEEIIYGIETVRMAAEILGKSQDTARANIIYSVVEKWITELELIERAGKFTVFVDTHFGIAEKRKLAQTAPFLLTPGTSAKSFVAGFAEQYSKVDYSAVDIVRLTSLRGQASLKFAGWALRHSAHTSRRTQTLLGIAQPDTIRDPSETLPELTEPLEELQEIEIRSLFDDSNETVNLANHKALKVKGESKGWVDGFGKAKSSKRSEIRTISNAVFFNPAATAVATAHTEVTKIVKRKNSRVRLAAQDVSDKDPFRQYGPFTGDVPAGEIKKIPGVKSVLINQDFRHDIQKDRDRQKLVNKIQASFLNDLTPVYFLKSRDAIGVRQEISQLAQGLRKTGLPPFSIRKIRFVYGGKDPAMAREIRSSVKREMFGALFFLRWFFGWLFRPRVFYQAQPKDEVLRAFDGVYFAPSTFRRGFFATLNPFLKNLAKSWRSFIVIADAGQEAPLAKAEQLTDLERTLSRKQARLTIAASFPDLGNLGVTSGASKPNVILGSQITGRFVPAKRLAANGIRFAFAGHSEQKLKPEIINQKARWLLAESIRPVIPVGEKTPAAIELELEKLLRGFTAADVLDTVIMYEPPDAIAGSGGKAVDPETVNTRIEWLRRMLAHRYGEATAGRAQLIYGGSVSQFNAAELSKQPEVKGLAVGSASVNPAVFAEIVQPMEKGGTGLSKLEAQLSGENWQKALKQILRFLAAKKENSQHAALVASAIRRQPHYKRIHYRLLEDRYQDHTHPSVRVAVRTILKELGPIDVRRDLMRIDFEQNMESNGVATKSTVTVAAAVKDHDRVGKGFQEEEEIKEADKAETDAIARDTREGVAIQGKVAMENHFTEGGGRDVVMADNAGDITNPSHASDGAIKTAGDDVEGTENVATNNHGIPFEKMTHKDSGGTSLLLTGEGLGSIGYIPDAYMHVIVTHVPPQLVKRLSRLLDPDVYSEDPVQLRENVKKILTFIAKANGLRRGIQDIEIVVMHRDRETAMVRAFEELGVTVTEIEDGTFEHGVYAAAYGHKEANGKHKVLWTVGGAPEGASNLAVAAALTKQGAVGAGRIYSKEINYTEAGHLSKAYNMKRRFAFRESERNNNGETEVDEIRRLRKESGKKDAGAILKGQKIFRSMDIKGEIQTSIAFITGSGVFGIPGARKLENYNNAYLVNVLEIQGDSESGGTIGLSQRIVKDPKKMTELGGRQRKARQAIRDELADIMGIPHYRTGRQYLQNLTPGKLRGLTRLIDPKTGAIKILAIDQVGGFQTPLAEYHDERGEAKVVSADDVTGSKIAISNILSGDGTTVLHDPIYGARQSVNAGAVPRNTALMFRVEKSTPAGAPAEREPGWTMAELKASGTDNLAKLLVYLDVDDPEYMKKQLDLVHEVAREAATYDVLLMVECYSFQRPSEKEEFARIEKAHGKDSNEYKAMRLRYARRQARNAIQAGYVLSPYADILKLEFPGDIDLMPDEELWENLRLMNRLADKPWVQLTAGVDFKVFERQLRMSMKAGASGYAAGRAIFKEALIEPSPEARDHFLKTTGVQRMKIINSIVDRYATPVIRHRRDRGKTPWRNLRWEDIAVPEERWFEKYPDHSVAHNTSIPRKPLPTVDEVMNKEMKKNPIHRDSPASIIQAYQRDLDNLPTELAIGRENFLNLSPGKLRGLHGITFGEGEDEGLANIMAMDQSNSFRRFLIAQEKRRRMSKGDIKYRPSYGEYLAPKKTLVKKSGDLPTGILIDIPYGALDIVSEGILPRDTALIGRLEESYDPAPAKRERGLTVAKLKRMGNTGVKILFYMDVENEPFTRQQLELARQIKKEADEEGILLLVEELTFLREGETKDSPEFIKRQRINAIQSARLLRPFADILKLEPIVGIEQVNGVKIDYGKWLNAAAGRDPWVVLSAGESFDKFIVKLRELLHYGAIGAMVGRATWQEFFEKGEDWLGVIGRSRLRELDQAVRQYGIPWMKRFSLTHADMRAAVQPGWHLAGTKPTPRRSELRVTPPRSEARAIKLPQAKPPVPSAFSEIGDWQAKYGDALRMIKEQVLGKNRPYWPFHWVIVHVTDGIAVPIPAHLVPHVRELLEADTLYPFGKPVAPGTSQIALDILLTNQLPAADDSFYFGLARNLMDDRGRFISLTVVGGDPDLAQQRQLAFAHDYRQYPGLAKRLKIQVVPLNRLNQAIQEAIGEVRKMVPGGAGAEFFDHVTISSSSLEWLEQVMAPAWRIHDDLTYRSAGVQAYRIREELNLGQRRLAPEKIKQLMELKSRIISALKGLISEENLSLISQAFDRAWASRSFAWNA
ncbi:MAG: phosphoglycerate kinase, partial [Candidatus Omnitrophica bacterium]|nr:phosphoglycerate kinase [Candidatus Omnitrophota bacterium]